MPEKLNSRSLRQAREARKLSIQEVAAFTRIAEERLRRFEAGDLEPSLHQIMRLSELYNAPFQKLYGDTPLVLEQTLPDFRKQTPSAADLSPKGLTRLWQIEHRAKFIEELSKALGKEAPETASLTRLTNKARPDPSELRAGFDRWLDGRERSLKFSGNPENAFQRQLRIFLETRACLTSQNSAPVDDYLGFFQNISKRSKVIFINSEVRHEKRRLFTLAHEMAHFVYDEEGISNPFVARNDIERRCNAFAAEFLASDHQVFAIVSRATVGSLHDVHRLASMVARDTLLSRQAATLRLQDLGVITKKAASEFFAYLAGLRRISEPSSEVQKDPPKGRSIVIGRKLSEVGLYAAYTAAVALKKKIVDVVDVERGLGLSESIQKDVLDLASRRYEAAAE